MFTNIIYDAYAGQKHTHIVLHTLVPMWDSYNNIIEGFVNHHLDFKHSYAIKSTQLVIGKQSGSINPL